MKRSFFLLIVMVMFLSLGTSCTTRYHFGVPDQAIGYPTQFDETEAAVAQAEQSPGAKYCPEKIAKAKELGKEGVKIWWICDQPTAWKLFAEARQLAAEAEGCKQPPPPSAPPKPAPPPPMEKDSDNDGVPDSRDKCPGTPAGVTVDKDGCPPPSRVIDKLTLQILFDTDKATITEAGQMELQKAVVFVKKYPGAKIEVEGYTDSVGPDAYNMKLSERRATAVKDYLVEEANVESSKITAVGYGEAKPVVDNKTAAGRAQNRRVEILILSD
jgi:outer membrane protein OmpA-like peptidoglycan-associated protein